MSYNGYNNFETWLCYSWILEENDLKKRFESIACNADFASIVREYYLNELATIFDDRSGFLYDLAVNSVKVVNFNEIAKKLQVE